MKIIYLLYYLKPITVQSLPLLPWWAWLLVLAASWTGLILWNPLPWWGWVLTASATLFYLITCFVVAMFSEMSM